MYYVQATLKFRSSRGYERFCQVMGAQRANLERNGWRMIGGWVGATGRVATVTHIWQIDSPNHFIEGTSKLRDFPEFEEFRDVTSEFLEEEVLTLMRTTPYSPPVSPLGSAS